MHIKLSAIKDVSHAEKVICIILMKSFFIIYRKMEGFLNTWSNQYFSSFYFGIEVTSQF
jgi:hypothetical protein